MILMYSIGMERGPDSIQRLKGCLVVFESDFKKVC